VNTHIKFEVTIETGNPHHPDLIRIKVKEGEESLRERHREVTGFGLDLSPVADLKGKTGAGYQAAEKGYVNFDSPPTPAQLDHLVATAKELFGETFHWLSWNP
jgi:hypothetical protein